MSLPDALERAASALPEAANEIRPANGDPGQLLEGLSTESASGLLTWLLSNEPGAGAELAIHWADLEPGVTALAGVVAEELPKAGRKALRKAQHRLRSRGLHLTEASPAAPKVARLAQVEERVEEGYVTPLDPRGALALYLVESHPSGGLRLFELGLDAARGVVGFEIYSASRSKTRRFLKQITGRQRFASVAVELATTCWLCTISLRT